MEKFNAQYGKYPEYPVADVGYGSFKEALIKSDANDGAHQIYSAVS